MRTCTELFTIANQLELASPADVKRLLDAASERCSARYRRAHPLVPAPNGGLVGIPRFINKNFKAWRDGPNVLVCPRDRFGPVYQFVFEDARWRFDGPFGELLPSGVLVRTPELAAPLVE
jgi:hypothetical protein